MDEHIWIREGVCPKMDEHMDEGGMCPRMDEHIWMREGRVPNLMKHIWMREGSVLKWMNIYE
jgi:hypothetical protein